MKKTGFATRFIHKSSNLSFSVNTDVTKFIILLFCEKVNQFNNIISKNMQSYNK